MAGLILGDPIWVESLLTEVECKQLSKKYTTYSGGKLIPMFECEFKWRWRMGSSLSQEEIIIINSRLDEIMKKAGLLRKT